MATASTATTFRDRVDAGRRLAEALQWLREKNPVVIGLPRGGVPVAREVAEALGAAMDVCIVRKIGTPGWTELGLGAVAEGGEVFVDQSLAHRLSVTDGQIEQLVATKRDEVARRAKLFRNGRAPIDVTGRNVIIVDDGVATGGTARAAIRTMRARGAKRVVFAVPVGASEALAVLAEEADDNVCLSTRDDLVAIGLWYDDFRQVSDEEVVRMLGGPRDSRAPLRARDVEIVIGKAVLEGELVVPTGARGLVLFAHGSGSSRKSPRNRQVAEALWSAGHATLLFDLLTAEEERRDRVDAHLRFDIGLLTARLDATTDWVRRQPDLRRLTIGYFGASTGAAAALRAAAGRSDVQAVVSRGGRPDLAANALERVRSATLLIVGGADYDVLTLNRLALRRLDCVKRLEVVPGATHLFEEPGALEEVARLAGEWFSTYLVPTTSAGAIEARDSHP